LGGVVPEPKNVREATEAFNNLVAAALAHVRSDLGHPLGGQSESDMSAHLRRMLYTLKLTALDEAGI
jgi:hypothetical protein